MAITFTSVTTQYDSGLTAKLRVWMAQNPIEQSALGNAFLDRVLKNNKNPINAANRYDVPVSFVEAAKGDYYAGFDQTSTAGSDDVTIAHYDHSMLTEPIKLSREDMKKNAKAQFNLMTHKIRQARLRLRNKLAADLMATSRASGPNGANGPETLPLMIAEAPSGTAFGAIDGANNAGWLNQFKDMSGGLAANLDDLDEVSIECTKNGLTDWDWIVCTTDIYKFFKAEARSNQQIDIGTAPAGTRIADTGWTGVTFEGKPVIHDRHCPAQSLFFINDDSVVLNVDPDDDFVLEGPFPLQPGGQHGMLWNIYWGGQLLCKERAALGVVFNITGA